MSLIFSSDLFQKIRSVQPMNFLRLNVDIKLIVWFLSNDSTTLHYDEINRDIFMHITQLIIYDSDTLKEHNSYKFNKIFFLNILHYKETYSKDHVIVKKKSVTQWKKNVPWALP